MNQMTLLVVLIAFCFHCSSAHTHGFEYSITSTVYDLFNVSGATESVEYDYDNKTYYFVDRSSGQIGNISSEYPLSSDDTDFTLNTFPDADPINSSTNGMVYYDGILYLANSGTGWLRSVDSNGSFGYFVYVGDGLNGLCQV